jgi:membrane-bound lytic murein transglycosylase D
MHGDWHLALASYNWGEHAVARAIAKNQAKGLPTDYASLTMPGETRYYVPKLQAIKNIVAQPELFGFSLSAIPNRAYFGTVDMRESVDIATAARLAETPLEEFIALNPAYHRPVIPGESKSPLVIPAEKMNTFLANLARHEAQDKPLSNWRTYTLKKGEKIDTVAGRFGLTVARLKQLNGITPKTKIVPGQNFLIPTSAIAHSDALAAALPKTPGDPPRAVRAVAKGKKKGAVVAKGAAAKKAPAHAVTKKPAAGKKPAAAAAKTKKHR